MKTAKYNGFSNWETWNVALWLNNDQDFYKNLAQPAAKMDYEQASSFLSGNIWDILDNTGKFGDITEVSELEQVNWAEVQEAIAND